MKKLTLAFAVLCALCALTYAGPERMEKEVMPAPIEPSSCFEGWYFGIHGDGIIANLDAETSAFEDTFGPRGGGFAESLFQTTDQHDESSGGGGFHGGYNWQHGGWVFGFEIDMTATDLQRSDEVFDFIQLPGGNSDEHVFATAISSKTALDWYGTGRVRIGHTLGQRILVFGTAGGALGLTEVDAVTGITENTRFGGDFTDQFTDNNREVRGGWTAGGGIDICLAQHWILNFTYLYVDLGNQSAGTDITFTSDEVDAGVRTFTSTTLATADFKFHVFRGGLTFKF